MKIPVNYPIDLFIALQSFQPARKSMYELKEGKKFLSKCYLFKLYEDKNLSNIKFAYF